MRTHRLRPVMAALLISAFPVSPLVHSITAASAQEAARAPAESTKTTADVDALRKRAAAFWAARVAGDPKAQWDLLEPRGRARMTPADYAPSGAAVKYLAYQVEDATIDGYFATVNVRLLVQIIAPHTSPQRRSLPPTGTVVTETWVQIGGTWYRSLEQAEGGVASQ